MLEPFLYDLLLMAENILGLHISQSLDPRVCSRYIAQLHIPCPENHWCILGSTNSPISNNQEEIPSKIPFFMYVLPGIKINDLALLDAGGFDRALIASRAIEGYLIQVRHQVKLLCISYP